MDSSFVDLDILLTRVRQPNSRKYFLEALKAYKAGALRAALTSTWVAVVYDLISKYRELAGMGDRAASTFVVTWDRATTNDDIPKLLQLERSIIEDATAKTQILSPLSKKQLVRLLDDRHLCAHPAFSTDADLFEPSPELVRLHLVNAIALVLSQEPLQGKAILDQYHLDVQDIGFPTAQNKVSDYVEQRYLNRVRPQNIKNFAIVLAKSLIKSVPPEWNTHRTKIVASLIAVRDRAPSSWQEVLASIIRLIDTIEPANRRHVITFLVDFPDFWQPLDAATKTALQETAANLPPENLGDYSILSAVTLPQFAASILALIPKLGQVQLHTAISRNPQKELWPPAIELYRASGSFRASEQYFRNFIAPFAGRLNSEQHDLLLDSVAANGQNWHAAETPALLLAVLSSSDAVNMPSHDARNRFYQRLRQFGQSARYGNVLNLFEGDGWTRQIAEPEEED